jgi:hypothetical protein
MRESYDHCCDATNGESCERRGAHPQRTQGHHDEDGCDKECHAQSLRYQCHNLLDCTREIGPSRCACRNRDASTADCERCPRNASGYSSGASRAVSWEALSAFGSPPGPFSVESHGRKSGSTAWLSRSR